MESLPQNPEFRNNRENFYPFLLKFSIFLILSLSTIELD